MIWCVEEEMRKYETTGVWCKPAKVFDATGAEIAAVVWMDTETGEVERLQLGPDGLVVLKDDRSDVERVRGFHPAPLLVVEIEQEAAK